MMLGRELEEQGSFLFRWRSFLPFVLIVPTVAALLDPNIIEIRFGEFTAHTWAVICLIISLMGQAWRSFAIGCAPGGTSGRNTDGQRADVLNTTGVYSLSRNPLYFGNFVVVMGFVLAIGEWWLALIVLLAFALYYERIIIAEEAYLDQKFGEAFRSWARVTPSFVPRLTGWVAPAQRFSLRKVLRKDYNGYALILITFPMIDFFADMLAEGKSPIRWIHEDSRWALLAMSGLVLLLTFRMIKRHTTLLSLSDR